MFVGCREAEKERLLLQTELREAFPDTSGDKAAKLHRKLQEIKQHHANMQINSSGVNSISHVALQLTNLQCQRDQDAPDGRL